MSKTEKYLAGAIGLIVLVAVAIGVLLVTHHSAGPKTFNADGEVRLIGTSCSHEGSSYDGYSDISSGREVDVTGPDGHLLAYSELMEGYDEGGDCVYEFTVLGLPRNLPWYGVEVSHRGTVHFTYDQLVHSGADLSLGD